jgi:type I restriction enzyme M protein
VGEDPKNIQERILGLFERVKTAVFDEVFDKNDTINLDANSLSYVVGELQNYCVMDADRDAIGDAFEVFIGPALRGSEGQFFTPRNVIKMIVEMVDPKPGESIIDPACGSGGFLITSLDHVWQKLREEGKQKNWSERQLLKREIEVATLNFRGIDKDAFLAKVTKAYMALIGDGRGGIFCENSLLAPDEWKNPVMKEKIKLGSFDVVFTNPPFGKKIVVKGANILSQYQLSHKWKRDPESDRMVPTEELKEEQAPQVPFIERCFQLLKPGGRMGIVIPEAISGMPTYEYVVTYLENNAKILGVISMPEALFKTSGKGGTHAKVCVVLLQKLEEPVTDDYEIFMADVKWCGHDSRGNPTYRQKEDGTMELLDDVPLVVDRYKELVKVR